MSLREELAERLRDVATAVPIPKCECGAWKVPVQEVQRLTSLAAADECIRQMEWARRQGMLKATEECVRNVKNTINVPLTLAPEDWKP